jgi:hypothetical protein
MQTQLQWSNYNKAAEDAKATIEQSKKKQE